MNKWTDQITLISVSEGGQDEDGFPTDVQETETTVFCNMQSVKETEFFRAAERGVNALYTAVLHDYEYHGERFAEFNGERYLVYRSYVKQDKEVVELTLAQNVRD
jgi:SPP1 family predicted phage head-tail adaptor